MLETTSTAPLWPQGFDPLNVERIAPTGILHKRYLKLGNDTGYVEVLGASAITDGFGPHPLFQGIRHAVIAGLPKPVVTAAASKVSIRMDAVTVSFEPATAAVSGTTVTGAR